MYITPCHHCPLKKPCQKRHPLASQLHALDVRSAYIKCDDWKDLFPLGSEVVASLRFDVTNEIHGGDYIYYESIPCIICGTKRDKLWLWPLEKVDHVFITKWADDVTKVENGKTHEICKECNKPLDQKLNGWLCDTCGIPYMDASLEQVADFSVRSKKGF